MGKKLLAFALCLIMFLSVGTTTYAVETPTLENEPENYLVYDIKTKTTTSHSFDDLPEVKGQSSPGYFPNGCQPPSTRAVITGSNLTLVTNTSQGPYCNTVFIEIEYNNGTKSNFSGFMIGPSAAVTAAHCVWEAYLNNNYRSITVVPAKRGSSEPFGRTTVTQLVIPDYFVEDRAHDWAILELDDDIGYQTGWLGIKTASSFTGTIVTHTGYPDQGLVIGQNSNDSLMFESHGTVRETTAFNTFKGDWSAVSGCSGGPVFAYYSNTGYTAIGILTGGSSTNGAYSSSNYTMATKISQRMYSLFMTYR